MHWLNACHAFQKLKIQKTVLQIGKLSVSMFMKEVAYAKRNHQDR